MKRGVTDETAFVSALSEADVLPFLQQAPPALPEAPRARAPQPSEVQPTEVQLTVEQYASLCAERAARPQLASEVEQRYGLRSGAASLLAAAWARRFDADPELGSRFAALVDQYARWFRQRDGEG